jgi:glycosyltransferase involved in cell wall biosynthesis
MQCEQAMTTLESISLKPLPPNPLVSVIMSNYNYVRFFSQAVESVLVQTYPHFKVIICDDGSTDDSRQVIDSCVQRDPRVRALYKPNGGQASALNLAYEHAQGEMICLLDADDLFNPRKLEVVVAAFAGHPTSGFCHHRLIPVANPGHPVRPPTLYVLDSGWLVDEALRRGGWGSYADTSGICLRRDLGDRIFPIPDCLRLCPDAYLACTAQFLTELIAVPDTLGQYRVHGKNPSGFLRPTAHSVTVNADFIELIFSEIQAFVAETHGDIIARRLRLDDLTTWYWDNLLALYILYGKPSAGVHVSGKRFWRCLLALPSTVAWRFLQFWWGGRPSWRMKMTLPRSLGRI